MKRFFKNNLKQKEIVLLPFPFSDLSGKKIRPALIVSNNGFNKKSDDLLLVPLTAVIKKQPYSVLVESKDLSSGWLIKSSRIRADKIFAVEKKLVISKIGRLRGNSFRLVQKEIYSIVN